MSSSRLKKKSLSQEDLFNFSELFKLMKPRVMSLVIFTCAVGLLTSPGIISTKDAIIGILLVSIGAGATTLEWTVPSPPNFHTFEELPKFEDDQHTQKSHS